MRREHNTPAFEIRYEITNTFSRFPCDLCGGCTDKEPVIAMLVEPCGDGTGRQVTDVCSQCLAAGSGGLRDRILAHASRVQAEADYLRTLANAEVRWPASDFNAICEAADRHGQDRRAEINAQFTGELVGHGAGEGLVFLK